MVTALRFIVGPSFVFELQDDFKLGFFASGLSPELQASGHVGSFLPTGGFPVDPKQLLIGTARNGSKPHKEIRPLPLKDELQWTTVAAPAQAFAVKERARCACTWENQCAGEGLNQPNRLRREPDLAGRWRIALQGNIEFGRYRPRLPCESRHFNSPDGCSKGGMFEIGTRRGNEFGCEIRRAFGHGNVGDSPRGRRIIVQPDHLPRLSTDDDSIEGRGLPHHPKASLNSGHRNRNDHFLMIGIITVERNQILHLCADPPVNSNPQYQLGALVRQQFNAIDPDIPSLLLLFHYLAAAARRESIEDQFTVALVGKRKACLGDAAALLGSKVQMRGGGQPRLVHDVIPP